MKWRSDPLIAERIKPFERSRLEALRVVGRTVEFTGDKEYMVRKAKTAQYVEPGGVQVISTFGDERNALVLVTFRIALGPGGAMVTMARACLYSLDENKKIKEEQDEFLVLSQ